MPTLRRTLEDIKKALVEINVSPKQERDALAADREAALLRLKSYRYLAGVPYENLVLDDELNKYASAAARICEKLGRLDHNPPNPGLPEEEYQIARKSAGNCNLAFRPRASLSTSVDFFMHDSDPTNIVRLGHRRWCLSLLMKKVGFGRAGNCHAIWLSDRGQQAYPALDFIAYPAPGLMPVEFFGDEYAWSTSLNPGKYAPPDDSVEVSIYPTDQSGVKSGTGLPLNNVCVNRAPRGWIDNCIIFRPDRSAVAAGKRYLVEIKGIRYANGMSSPPLRYPVEFVRLGSFTSAPGTQPAQTRTYAIIQNQTAGVVQLVINKNEAPSKLEAGKSFTVTTALPANGHVMQLLSADPKDGGIPLHVHNGYRYIISTEGKGYSIKKLRDGAEQKEAESLKKETPAAPLPKGDAEAVKKRLVGLTNEFREKEGVKSLKANQALARAAQQHAEALAKLDKAEGDTPQSPGGKGLTERLQAEGYQGSTSAAIVFDTSPDPARASFLRLKNSPPHRNIMLNTEIEFIGVGAARSSSGRWWICHVFGQ
jgi:uncharacterized protein YkwD